MLLGCLKEVDGGNPFLVGTDIVGKLEGRVGIFFSREKKSFWLTERS